MCLSCQSAGYIWNICRENVFDSPHPAHIWYELNPLILAWDKNTDALSPFSHSLSCFFYLSWKIIFNCSANCTHERNVPTAHAQFTFWLWNTIRWNAPSSTSTSFQCDFFFIDALFIHNFKFQRINTFATRICFMTIQPKNIMEKLRARLLKWKGKIIQYKSCPVSYTWQNWRMQK